MPFPNNFGDLVFGKVEPSQRGQSYVGQRPDLVAREVQMLQVLELFRREDIQTRHLIFGSVQPDQIVESVDDRDICDCVCADIQKSDFFIVQDDGEKSFDFLFGDAKASIGYRLVVRSLAQAAECSFQGLLQLFQILLCLQSGLFLNLFPLFLLQAFLLFLLLVFLVDLLLCLFWRSLLSLLGHRFAVVQLIRQSSNQNLLSKL